MCIYICILIILYHFSNADHVPVATLSSCKAVSGFWWTWNWRYLNLPATLIFNPLLFSFNLLLQLSAPLNQHRKGMDIDFEKKTVNRMFYCIYKVFIVFWDSLLSGWEVYNGKSFPLLVKKNLSSGGLRFSFRTLAFCLQGIF